MTNEFHPPHVLADLLTMQEHSTKPLQEMACSYLGDAYNNMSKSLLVGAAKMGTDYRSIAPSALQPE